MRRFILGSSAAVLALLLTACGSDDPSTGGSAPSSSSSSSSASASSSAAATEPTDSESTSSTVAAATGSLLSGPTASLNAPADWTGEVMNERDGAGMLGPDISADYLQLSDTELLTDSSDVEALAKEQQETSSIDPPLTRQPDVTIAGQPAFHFAGEDKAFVRWTEIWGFASGDHLIRVTIGSPMDQPQAERDATSAAILASVKITG